MKTFARCVASAALLSICSPAFAEPDWLVQPVQVGQETVRYLRGVPTLDLELNDGVVQITPLPLDHGSLTFMVAVYNDSLKPANFGIENVGAAFHEKAVTVFTKDELVRQAKNRATWTQIGLALLGGAAAGIAASQRDYYSSSIITPRGTYYSSFSAPSVGGQIAAGSIAVGTGFGIGAVQAQLDNTVRALGDQVVQLTTVYPGESYAGRIVIAKINPNPMPSRVTLSINWNGETYPFTFQVAKRGTATPEFTAITRQSDLIDFRQRAAAARSVAQPPSPVQSTNPVIAVADSARQPARSEEVGRSLGGGVVCVTCR